MIKTDKEIRCSNIKNQFNCHQISSLTYVQGMNVMAAPFLMVMKEMEAFHTFSTFIWRWCPLYVQPTMRGVHCGLRVSMIFKTLYICSLLIKSLHFF